MCRISHIVFELVPKWLKKWFPMLFAINLVLNCWVTVILYWVQLSEVWITRNCAKWRNLPNDGAFDVILKGKSHQMANFGQIGGCLTTLKAWVLFELSGVCVWFWFRGLQAWFLEVWLKIGTLGSLVRWVELAEQFGDTPMSPLIALNFFI